MATVRGILNLLPGDYWNHDVVWQIRTSETGDIVFCGKWDEAVKLSDDILDCQVDVYSWWPSSYNMTTRQITYFKDSAE